MFILLFEEIVLKWQAQTELKSYEHLDGDIIGLVNKKMKGGVNF